MSERRPAASTMHFLKWLPRSAAAGGLLLAVHVVACSDVGGSWVTDPCVPWCGEPAEPIYSILPAESRILRGDTVRLYACPYAFSCDEKPVPSRWTLSSGLRLAMAGDSAVRTVASAGSILVQGIARGPAVAVGRVPSGAVAQGSVIVADSADITSIDVYRPAEWHDTLHAHTHYGFAARLRDKLGADYRGRPTAWAVSDSTILRIVQIVNSDFETSVRLFTEKPGHAELHVRFRDVSTIVRFTVVP